MSRYVSTAIGSFGLLLLLVGAAGAVPTVSSPSLPVKAGNDGVYCEVTNHGNAAADVTVGIFDAVAGGAAIASNNDPALAPGKIVTTSTTNTGSSYFCTETGLPLKKTSVMLCLVGPGGFSTPTVSCGTVVSNP